jgi:hypothetical protein
MEGFLHSPAAEALFSLCCVFLIFASLRAGSMVLTLTWTAVLAIGTLAFLCGPSQWVVVAGFLALGAGAVWTIRRTGLRGRTRRT